MGVNLPWGLSRPPQDPALDEALSRRPKIKQESAARTKNSKARGELLPG